MFALLCLLSTIGYAQGAATGAAVRNENTIPATNSTKAVPAPISDLAPAETPLLNPLPTVLSGGSDHFIKYWDATGRMSGTVGTHDATINAIAIAFPKDRKGIAQPVLVSGGKGGQLKTWALNGATQANAMPISSTEAHQGGVTALAVSRDGKRIATGGEDAYIRIWNLQDCKLLGEFKAHDAAIRSLQFSADGHTLISGSEDHLIRVWKVGGVEAMLDYQSTILGHEAAVTSVALSPDASIIASVSKDGYLKLWNIHGGSLIRQIRVTPQSILSVAFSPKGTQIATGDSQGRIRIWNARTGQPTNFQGNHTRGVHTLVWTPDGGMLISGGDDRTLSYWDAATGRNIARLAAHDGAVETIAIMP